MFKKKTSDPLPGATTWTITVLLIHFRRLSPNIHTDPLLRQLTIDHTYRLTATNRGRKLHLFPRGLQLLLFLLASQTWQARVGGHLGKGPWSAPKLLGGAQQVLLVRTAQAIWFCSKPNFHWYLRRICLVVQANVVPRAVDGLLSSLQRIPTVRPVDATPERHIVQDKGLKVTMIGDSTMEVGAASERLHGSGTYYSLHWVFKRLRYCFHRIPHPVS